MVIQAYVLLQTDIGASVAVSAGLAEISGVVQADVVTGPYDVIARIEAATIEDLSKVVISRIQQVPGISRMVTCTTVTP